MDDLRVKQVHIKQANPNKTLKYPIHIRHHTTKEQKNKIHKKTLQKKKEDNRANKAKISSEANK